MNSPMHSAEGTTTCTHIKYFDI